VVLSNEISVQFLSSFSWIEQMTTKEKSSGICSVLQVLNY
jgi:hypothetical protein